MTRVLTEEEYSKAAEELGLPIETVKQLVRKAEEVPTGLKEAYKEITDLDEKEKTNGGGANASKRQNIDADGKPRKEDEEEDLDGVEDTSKEGDFDLEELKETILSLSEGEFLQLKDVISDVEEMPTIGKLSLRLEELVSVVKANSVAITSLTTMTVKSANGNESTGDNQADIQEAIKDLLSNVPRANAGQFANELTDPPARDGQYSDDEVMAKLKSIEEKLSSNNKDSKDVYSLFTSNKLNSGK